MIVSCECGAKLKIDDAKISGKGVKVRCPRCGNLIPVQKPSPASSVSSENKAAPTAVPAALSDALVLVAHDSDVVRKMVADLLIDAGFRVDTAADGVDALKRAMENKPQGMVLDVGLPGIYGFELCERLKGNPATQSIKIVLLSSVYDMRRYKRTPTNLYGADDYIEKHHIPDFLLTKLRKLIFPGQFSVEMPTIKEAFSPRSSGDVPAAGKGIQVVSAQSPKPGASGTKRTRVDTVPLCSVETRIHGRSGWGCGFPGVSQSRCLDLSE